MLEPSAQGARTLLAVNPSDLFAGAGAWDLERVVDRCEQLYAEVVGARR